MAGRQRQAVEAAAPQLREFTAQLRTLVDERFVSVQDVAKAAHVGRSTVYEALSGRRLPSRDVVLAIVRACGGQESDWHERWQATRLALLHTPDTTAPESGDADQPAGNRPLTTPLTPTDPRRVGPFRLQGVLGSGSVGRVYLAHTPGGQAVAVKVVRPEFADDPGFRRRFHREVTAARAVHGLFTAPVIDADPDAPRPWLATAYVAGPSLRAVVLDHGPMPTENVTRLASGVCEALHAIHAAGIVHRDLNPGNVLLAAEGPKVIDFGIAHAADASHHTRTDSPLGTAAFMAPEQATGGQVSPATDVFALGALLTYAATATPPFGEGAPETILYRVVHAEPDLDQIADQQLRELVAACLAKDPQARPTVAQLRQRLSPATGEFDAAWLPPSVAADLPRHMSPRAPRRRRRLVVTAAAVAALMLLGAVLLHDATGSPPTGSASGDHPLGLSTSLAPPPRSHTTAAGAGPVGTTTPAAPSSSAPAFIPPAGNAPSTGGTGAGNSGRGTSPGTQAAAHGAVPAPAPAQPAVAPTSRVSFENGTADWTGYWGKQKLAVNLTTQFAYDGTHALLATAGPGGDACAVGSDTIPGVTAGTVVTLRVWYDGQGQGDIHPFVQDPSSTSHWAAPIIPLSVTASHWSTVTFTVPNVPVHAIGFQIDNTGSGNLDVGLDAVNW